VVLGSGREAALMIERGVVLRGSDRLASAEGDLVLVIAAKEHVSTIVSTDLRLLARIAYHLGNRHIPLQIGDGFVRYQHDHVLDHMVRELGLEAKIEDAPFEPEAGAYGQHSHGHSHAHDHPHVKLRPRHTGHNA
jgi:urease accessory protein